MRYYLIALLCFWSAHVRADELADQKKLLRESRYAWNEMKEDKESAIPKSLVQDACGILIFPGMIKGGFFVGGTYGKGVIFHKDKENHRWHGPLFVSMGGASLGFQIGVANVDVILLVMQERAIESITNGKVTFGTDLSATAGPVGRDLVVDADAKMTTSIFSYYKSKGIFAGVSLKGGYITPSEDDNQEFYGDSLVSHDILFKEPLPRQHIEVTKLVDSLSRY